MRTARSRRIAATAALWLAASVVALPQSGRADDVILDLWMRWRLDDETVLRSDDPEDEVTQVKPRFTTEGNLSYGPWSLTALVEVRSVVKPPPGENAYFENIGIYAEELYIAYTSDTWIAYAGKFDPRFGRAFDTAPGLYGDEFAKDYEIEEQIGGGIVFDIATGSYLLGDADISVNVFMADRTRLSNSAFTRRGRLHYDDGGPANTHAPQSFTVTLDGNDPGFLPGLTYNAGVISRVAGVGGVENELGAVFGAVQEIALTDEINLEIMAEVARFISFEGEGDNRTYLTTGAELQYDGWRFAVGGAAILFDPGGGADNNDTLFTVNLRRDWKIGPGRLRAEAGWALIDEAAIESSNLGLRIEYRMPLTIIF